MINFYEFIEKDIDAKKTLIATFPTRTKTNKKKFNEELDSITNKYNEYKENVKKYITVKSRSFKIKEESKNIEDIELNIAILEHLRNLLNPSNTSFEKLGFAELIYQLRNSYMFNFNMLNEIINNLIDKFEMAGIKIDNETFNYTCYVNEYMNSFLEVRRKKDGDYSKVSEIFEKIYWINPELIQHIELNFRRLIIQNDKNLNAYIEKISREEMKELDIHNYEELIQKLKILYQRLAEAKEESAYEIVEGAKNGLFDINQYLKNSKVRLNAYATLVDPNVDYDDKDKMNKVCTTLEQLKRNILEYDNYIKFEAIFKNFKESYESLISVTNKEYKGLKEIRDIIADKEKELDRMNKKLFNKHGQIEDKDNKLEKARSINLAKEIYDLYSKNDEEFFKTQVLKVIDKSNSAADVLNLYYSFSFYKMIAIQKAFNSSDYKEINKYANEFDLFARDLSNVIIEGIPVFESFNEPRVIASKYRLHNIKVDEADLQPENIKALLNKIMVILRTNTINNSSITIDKIWFIVNVNKILEKEENKA